MKIQNSRLAIVFAFAISFLASSALQAQVQPPYRQDQILVKPLSSQIANLHAIVGSTVVRQWPR